MAVTSASESELRAKFAAIRRWQAISRVVTAITVLVVAGEFYYFYKSTRSTVEGAFSEQGRMQKALQQNVKEVSPNVGAMLKRVADEAMPVYRKMAAERYAVLRESLGAKAKERLQKLPEDGNNLLKEKLQIAMEGALKKIEPEVTGTFPALTDPKQRDVLIHDFLAAAEEKNKTIAAKIDKLRVDELGRVKSVMDKFALPPDEMAAKDEEAGKELIRTMLLLAQAHLDDMDAADGKPVKPAPMGSTGN
jgi:hypothetical protein